MTPYNQHWRQSEGHCSCVKVIGIRWKKLWPNWKRSLAIVFAIKKSIKMFYEHHFSLVTDYKTLVTIFGFKKGIPDYTANRLQRFYNYVPLYKFNWSYRSLIQTWMRTRAHSCFGSIHETINYFTAHNYCKNSASHFTEGSHAESDSLPPDTESSSIFRQTVSIFLPSAIINDYILFRERVTVSLSLQNRVIKQFDLGHESISHMKDLACSYIYWPKKEIEDLTHNCSKSQIAAMFLRKSTLFSWSVPDSPWSCHHIEFVSLINWQMAGNFPHELHHLWGNPLQKIFNRFGVPGTLFFDNVIAITQQNVQISANTMLFNMYVHPHSIHKRRHL